MVTCSIQVVGAIFFNTMLKGETKREYDRKWVAKRRFDFFSLQKCAYCGSKSNLELHHLDPSTKITSSIWSWKESRRLEEIAKCIILCHNCHLIETSKQVTINHPHGTVSKYNKGCKCDECLYALREYWKTRRNKLREEFGKDFRKLNITETRKKNTAAITQLA
jgi:hypothetical protein